MEAKGQPLRFLCDEQILEIPFFQRAYVWNDDNWNFHISLLYPSHPKY